MAERKRWFISHPSGATEHTPLFFQALRAFGNEAAEQIELVLPHEKDEEVVLTKKDIESSELVIVEVSIPSTGSGIELGWANTAGKPIIAFNQGGSQTSPALKFVITEIHAYFSAGDITKILQEKR